MEAFDEKRSRSVLVSLYKTWKERLYCDITLKCGSKTIQAHKLVLISVSDYFKNLFKYEVTKIEYDLDCNIFKDSIIEHIVLFAYTGKIKIDEFIVQDLLVAASFLQIKFIIFECEKFMAQNIEMDNIIPLVSLTNQFNLKSLLGPVCNFISSNVQELSNNGEKITIWEKTFMEKNDYKCPNCECGVLYNTASGGMSQNARCFNSYINKQKIRSLKLNNINKHIKR